MRALSGSQVGRLRIAAQQRLFKEAGAALCRRLAVYVAHYNLCRVHEALRATPAMDLGIAGSGLDDWRTGGRGAGYAADRSDRDGAGSAQAVPGNRGREAALSGFPWFYAAIWSIAR